MSPATGPAYCGGTALMSDGAAVATTVAMTVTQFTYLIATLP
jgi:hypothetical protein